MRVLLDTSVWSIFLRRPALLVNPDQDRLRQVVADMIADGLVVLPGVVRQEILSGIKDEATFLKVKTVLRAIDDEPLTTADFEDAAAAFTACRRAGVAPTFVDMTICALAMRLKVPILTLDKDFFHYQRALAIKILDLRD